MKKISVFGSTGSIGTQTLDIVSKFEQKFEVFALTAHSNIALLEQQILKYNPQVVGLTAENEKTLALRSRFPQVEFYLGERAAEQVAELGSAEIVVMGISGFAALKPTLAAAKLGKTIALANKETLVAGGCLLQKAFKHHQSLILPVDSEHNALFQLLEKNDPHQVADLILTASGGPLLKKKNLELKKVTPEMAVNHPNWEMGAKISVDSATMMNKGLEFIEAHYLFDWPTSHIKVWIHPQSLVHGALRMKDNSYLLQMNAPDMRLSIGYALEYPQRLPNVIEPLPISKMQQLEFYEPDRAQFPCFFLATKALEAGPGYVIALNAANEVLVDAFLNRRIGFDQISTGIEQLLQSTFPVPCAIEEIYEQDHRVRAQARDWIEKNPRSF